MLIRETRSDKLTQISTHELRKRQRARLAPGERDLLIAIRSRSRVASPVFESTAPSLQYAKDHTFERVSVAPDHELLAEALRHGRELISLAELKGELKLEERVMIDNTHVVVLRGTGRDMVAVVQFPYSM